LNGNASTATSATSATSFSGSLSGDVTGTQGATVVSSVGGQTAANVAAGMSLANAAANSNTASTIVRRDASGNFSAGTITANLIGNVTGNISTATALAANGANCTGNNFALGVDASGAAECAQPAFSNLSGTATVSQGGTGLTSSGTAGNYLRSNGTAWAASTIQASDLPSLSGNYVDLTTNQSVAGNKTFTGTTTFSTTSTIDATAATKTLPIRAVTVATIPVGAGACIASKELIIVSDETPGRQLYICNSAGTGFQLLGDGLGSSGITFNQVAVAANNMTLTKNTCSAAYTGTYPNQIANQDLPMPAVNGQLTSTSTLVVSPVSTLPNTMPVGWTSYTYYAYVDTNNNAFLHVCNPTQFNAVASGAITFNVRALN
jgi:hypothetical protein